MKNRDINEEKIYEMFKQIDVDTSRVSQGVKEQLNKPDTNKKVKNNRPWVRSTVAVMALFIFLGGGAVAAGVVGNFSWFMDSFKPDYSEIVEPVEAYMEDQGIKMEVIGAKKYDNRAIVYLSLQDTTGQNRLTERTNFQDGFSVKTSQRSKVKKGRDTLASGISWSEDVVYFDEDSNTIYYEFNITTDLATPFTEKLQIGSSRIYFDEKRFTREPINLALADIKKADTIDIKTKEVWGGMNHDDDFEKKDQSIKALRPGKLASMPHNNDKQWISNIGIIDGDLHVQIGKVFNEEFGTSDANIDLRDDKGNIIPCDSSLVLLTDESNNILNLKRYDYKDAIYKYEEFIFPIEEGKLDKYQLLYTGFISTGLEGDWKLAADLDELHNNILSWTEDMEIDGYKIEYITLSPLGLSIMGSYEEDDPYIDLDQMLVQIETKDGISNLEFGSGSQDHVNKQFNWDWDSKKPIDIEKVKAIVINDIYMEK